LIDLRYFSDSLSDDSSNLIDVGVFEYVCFFIFSWFLVVL
jgi:hypothetical protein